MKAIAFIVSGGLVLLGSALLIPGLLPDAAAVTSTDHSRESFSPYVDQDGNISRPTGFRQNWAHMGTWYVPETKQAAGPGFHDVYASPGTVEAYKKSGKFPDGAVLVKEISAIKTKPLTTGDANWAGDTAAWFVMVKDRKNRFPDNPVWGEGWGWALFKADKPSVNVAHNWKQDTGLGLPYPDQANGLGLHRGLSHFTEREIAAQYADGSARFISAHLYANYSFSSIQQL